jgi:reverse gyrase
MLTLAEKLEVFDSIDNPSHLDDPLTIATVEAWIRSYETGAAPPFDTESIVWDLRRRFGNDACELLRLASDVFDGSAYDDGMIAWQLDGADRPKTSADIDIALEIGRRPPLALSDKGLALLVEQQEWHKRRALWRAIARGEAEPPEATDEELTRADEFLKRWNAAMSPPPAAAAAPLPLLAGQAIVVDIGAPILSTFNAAQRGKPLEEATRLPDVMQGHPLFAALNDFVGHAIALAERSPAAFRASAIADGLAVLGLVHEETRKQVVARIRSTGAALPEGNIHLAVQALEARVNRAIRTGVGWRLNNRGEPDPVNADNVAVLLGVTGVEVRFNVWRQRVELRNGTSAWSPLTDAELNRLRGIASREEYRFRPSKDFFRDMLADLARQTSFDPVLDWIDSAQWDGLPRLAVWLSATCGVPCDPYHQAVGRNVIGGIVKRARNPGCKHDEVMILLGPQGTMKSTMCSILALDPEWFSDSVTFEGRPQDVIPQLFGKLVIELSELDGMHKRDVKSIKRFLSTQSDNVTLKYEALATDHKRRCIFIGTSNEQSPLVDDTGNRRFYPVRVEQEIDIDWLRVNIDQLIAEAAHLESNGDTFAIPREVWGDAALHQEAARTVSAVEDLIAAWFDRSVVTGSSGYYVLSSDVGSALTMARQPANAKVGNTMKRLGYVMARPYINGAQSRVWLKSVSGDISGCMRLAPHQPIGKPVEFRAQAG